MIGYLALILSVAAAFNPSPGNTRTEGGEDLTLELLYHPDSKVDLDGSPPRILRWLRDGDRYVESRAEPDSELSVLYAVQAETGDAHPLYDLERIRSGFASLAGISEEEAGRISQRGRFTLGPDEKSLLITFHGDLLYFHPETGRALRLTSSPQSEEVASFSPDGRKVAFLRDHDLYVIDLEKPREKRLTTGGGANLLNGSLDWVYQEELYGRGDYKAYWWSPDSRYIAYLQLDESPVPNFTVVDHIPQHLETETSRYPKAGDPNPLVRLAVVSASGGKSRWIDLSRYSPEDLLIVRVGWTPDSRSVVFQAQNKEQTWLDLNLSPPDGKQTETLFRETTPAWVEVLGEPEWLDDGTFLWLSERDGWRHLYHYDRSGKLIRQVTSGDWEVRAFHGFDRKSGWLYVSGTERSAIGLDLYRIAIDGRGLTRLSEEAGTHRIRFNEQMTRWIDSWSDIRTPAQTRLHGAGGEILRVIDENPAEELQKYRLGEPEFLHVKTRDGFLMEAMLIKPPDFDPSKRYPVLSNTYSGPHAPSVRNSWGGTGYLWHQLLAQKGYLVWVCDNRTASGKGARSAWPAHRNLGELELRDLEDGLAWLRQQPWVDGERIGLWGWSYGGYMTSYALTHSTSFRIGIVGAPVTDWTLYDTIYTERYMGTPKDNPEGYEKSSVLKAAGNLHGKMLLLHGTLDDNVHLQNSIRFMYELQKAGKPFEVMFYPRSRHGVHDPKLLYHMRQLMTNFVLENL